MAFAESTIRTVIEVLHDGQRGFTSLSKNLKNEKLKSFFTNEASHRGQFASELETALSAVTGKQVEEGGTTSGTIHRAWGELKGSMGGSDHTLLETAEQGEDVAKKAYAEALKVSDIPTPIRTILETQQTHIHQSHDQVKAMRDSLVGA